MNESKELAVIDEIPVDLAMVAAVSSDQQLATYSDDKLKEIGKSGDWFPRLQLCGGNTKIVKKQKIGIRRYALVTKDDDFVDLGPQVDIVIFNWRPKALDMSGENPISVYDETSALFKEIQSRSVQSNSMCSYGPEFLVWVPAAKAFGTFLLGSKTSRGESKSVAGYRGKACTLTWRECEQGSYIWECPVANPCTTPLEMPTKALMDAKIAKFNAEATTKAPEKADEKTTTRQR